MTAYYNEFDPFAAQYLRNLIRAGHIAPGDVDERSIIDVRENDLAGYTQCHFFAGIGGWSLALRLAGWPDDRPVWTGSCPCQPFSAAGKKAGMQDARHLWPEWFRLIHECKPDAIFGEQVTDAINHGWLDLVYDDLETINYAVGSAVIPAAGVGAPHTRSRLWFVAHANQQRHQRERVQLRQGVTGRHQRAVPEIIGHRGACRLENPAGLPGSFWGCADWIPCRDGKYRPVEPGTFPLANGVPARVGRLRTFGNAIVPQVAAEMIMAYREYVGDA